MRDKIPCVLEGIKDMGRERYTEHLKLKYADMEDTITDNTRIMGVGAERKDHLYTWERIYHFLCGECKNWWSYATTEDSYTWKSRRMTCPHCNYHAVIKPNPEMSKEI